MLSATDRELRRYFMNGVPVPKRSVTFYDVARAVGVSRSAVSRAFTPKARSPTPSGS